MKKVVLNCIYLLTVVSMVASCSKDDDSVAVATPNEPIPALSSVTGLSSPYGLAIKDNFLYIAEYFGDRIVKVNINEENPEKIVVADNLEGPLAVCFKGDDLYFTQYDGGLISKINTVESNATVETIEDTIDLEIAYNPSGIIINGNDLYYTTNDNGYLRKKNLLSNAISEIAKSNLQSPVGIEIVGNNIYVAQNQSNGSVVVLDASNFYTETGTITNLNSPTDIIHHNGNLFIVQSFADKISKIAIENATNSAVTDVATGLNYPVGATVYGNQLYYSEYDFGVDRIAID